MDTNKQKLSDNLEDYLEIISTLEEQNGTARPTDIATAMHVKKPSVTVALATLAERGLVVYEKYKPVILTEEGKEIAQSIRRKHKMLSDFFTDILGVEASQADIAACKMEHALDDSIMSKLSKFLKGIANANKCSNCASDGQCCQNCPDAVSLSELKIGQKAIVLSINDNIGNIGTYAGMGLTIGSTVQIDRIAPFGDPAIIKVRGSAISMRKAQLKEIKIKRI